MSDDNMNQPSGAQKMLGDFASALVHVSAWNPDSAHRLPGLLPGPRRRP